LIVYGEQNLEIGEKNCKAIDDEKRWRCRVARDFRCKTAGADADCTSTKWNNYIYILYGHPFLQPVASPTARLRGLRQQPAPK
jgi:hypothetical protein